MGETRCPIFADEDSRKIIGKALVEAYKIHPDLSVLYADVGKRFALEMYQKMGGYTLETGIAEQNMLGVAAGLCHEGVPTVAISYAPFLIGRAFDQIRANIGEMHLPIILIGAPSGFSAGGLGPLSICVDDIALMRAVPELMIVSPADGLETVKAVLFAIECGQPVYIRMTGKKLKPVYNENYSFQIGRAVLLRKGKQIAVIGSGAILTEILSAADRLYAEEKPITVINMHTVCPLDTETLDRCMDYSYIVTVEEHSVFGGLGSAVAEYLAGYPRHPKLIRLGLSGEYPRADYYYELLERSGLSAEQLYQKLSQLF